MLYAPVPPGSLVSVSAGEEAVVFSSAAVEANFEEIIRRGYVLEIKNGKDTGSDKGGGDGGGCFPEKAGDQKNGGELNRGFLMQVCIVFERVARFNRYSEKKAAEPGMQNASGPIKKQSGLLIVLFALT